MMTLLPMGVVHLQVKTIFFFNVLFETNCIILYLKIYICFLQLIH